MVMIDRGAGESTFPRSGTIDPFQQQALQPGHGPAEPIETLWQSQNGGRTMLGQLGVHREELTPGSRDGEAPKTIAHEPFEVLHGGHRRELHLRRRSAVAAQIDEPIESVPVLVCVLIQQSSELSVGDRASRLDPSGPVLTPRTDEVFCSAVCSAPWATVEQVISDDFPARFAQEPSRGGLPGATHAEKRQAMRMVTDSRGVQQRHALRGDREGRSPTNEVCQGEEAGGVLAELCLLSRRIEAKQRRVLPNEGVASVRLWNQIERDMFFRSSDE